MESVGAQISNQTKDNLCNLMAMGTTADQNKRHTMHQWSSMMEMNLTEGCPSSVCVCGGGEEWMNGFDRVRLTRFARRILLKE